MGGLKFDFGLLIAYVVPGVLLLYGVAPIVPDLNALLTIGDNDKAVITGIVITALSIVVGMVVSVIRFSTIDLTFERDMPFFDYERRPHLRGFKFEEINYSSLTAEGKLNAYLEAKGSERRPYQFYGNVLIVAIIASIIQLCLEFFSNPITSCLNAVIWVFVLIVSMFVLYPATRRACWKFSEAVKELNKNA